ncbi:hypothetical protein BDZ94DRAFT_289320 [Collybia nuda]|uniref:Uncharacterized protein n=1 Tax=Collybia nuda TaxID=64659 RepID=A0A9P5XU24_9AGAR|nr:hypothetical protein BDZ94DRAFT_289320 [Collybia nuda]
MLKIGNFRPNNKLQVVLNEDMEVEKENDKFLGSAGSSSNPPNGDQQGTDGDSRLSPSNEDIGIHETGAHHIAANESSLGGEGDTGSERELRIRIQDIEATGIRQDIEISAGRRRETRLQEENARLLAEREDLRKAYTELLPKMNIQNINLGSSTKREQLALEKSEKRHHHVTTLGVMQEDVHNKLVKITTERDELASLLQISKAKLEEVQLTLEGSRVLLKNSEAVAEKSTRALEGLKLALSEANTTISTKDAALVEARTDLGLSERLHEFTKTALSDSTTSLCDTQATLKELNRELLEVKQKSIQDSVLAGHWRETCLFERDEKVQFLSRLAAAGDAVHEALRLTNDSIQAGGNPACAFSGNVGPAIDRFQTLIKSEGKI